MQCRRGASIFQPYYNLVKLLRKDAVVSETSSWIFRATPYVTFISILIISLLVPVLSAQVPLNFTGDIILIIYLFALARFFLFGFAGYRQRIRRYGWKQGDDGVYGRTCNDTLLFTVALTVNSTNLSNITNLLHNNSVLLLNPSLFWHLRL